MKLRKAQNNDNLLLRKNNVQYKKIDLGTAVLEEMEQWSSG